MSGFIILPAGETTQEEKIINLKPMYIRMDKLSQEDDYEEKTGDYLEELIKEEAVYYLSLPETGYKESIVALEMILTSRGFVQEKNLDGGYGLWKK